MTRWGARDQKLDVIPTDRDRSTFRVRDRRFQLTNLKKVLWAKSGMTKAELLQYYVDVSDALLPHLADRPVLLRRYPNGPASAGFSMRRPPTPRPGWITTCAVEPSDARAAVLPVIDDLSSLLWTVNLGCIEISPFSARRDALDRPDHLCFTVEAGDSSFGHVREGALVLRDALLSRGMTPYVKTDGWTGLHVYVPIIRGPLPQHVSRVGGDIVSAVLQKHERIFTTERRPALQRPGTVLLAHRPSGAEAPLAAVYSARAHPLGGVSTPLAWEELSADPTEDWHIDNVPSRVRNLGDLWAGVTPGAPGRFDLSNVV